MLNRGGILMGSAKEEQAFEPPLIFEAVTGSARARILKKAVLKTIEAGTFLFQQGDLPSCQYVVVAGSVQLLGRSMGGQEVLIETLSASELVCPAAVLTASPYLVRARVPIDSRLLVVEAEAFRTAALREPAFARDVLVGLSCQFRRLLRQVKNLKLRDTRARVGCYLLTLAAQQGTPGQAVLPYEKSLIASELGMTRESFSRALSVLKRHGVAVKGDRITVEDEHRLARACQPDPLIDDPEQISGLYAVQRTPRQAPKPVEA
jgi:CRP/FNR family transcriptional regulator, transcriptional activator FtrB